MAIIFISVMVLWTVANLLFAFVDPPKSLESFMPNKIWALFGFLPAPWDRRAGMMFNACAGAAFLGIYISYM